jgi:hypothetical protein
MLYMVVLLYTVANDQFNNQTHCHLHGLHHQSSYKGFIEDIDRARKQCLWRGESPSLVLDN